MYCTTAKLSSEERKKSSFPKKKSLVGPTPVVNVISFFSRLDKSVRNRCLSSKKSSRFLKGTDLEEVRDDVLRNLKSLFGEKVKHVFINRL